MGMMIFDVYVGRIPPGKDIPRHLPAYYAGSFALLLPDFPQNPLEPLLQQGKDELKKRISERKPCADVFGGKDKALKALSQLKFSPGTLETGIMQINGNNVTVDQNPFNKSGRTLPLALNIRTSAVPGGTSTKYDLMALHLTGKEFAAFAVGHELGHKRKVYGEYDNDGESPFSNLAEGANNEKIRAACFGEFAPQSPPTR